MVLSKWQCCQVSVLLPTRQHCHLLSTMAPMKAMKAGGKAMTKGAIADAVAEKCELKKAGIFTVPGLCRIKTRMKPATKAGKREIFGKMTIVKAKPAKKVVKAFPAAALKASI